MSDAPVAGHRFARRPLEKAFDRAFVAAYAVALAGSLAVSLLTYVYVGPGVTGIREVNPVTAAIIDSLGLVGMVAVRTAVLVGSYWCYAYLRAKMRRSTPVIAFAWVGAFLQLSNLAVDLRVAVLAGMPSTSSLLAGLVVVGVALLAGVYLRPPTDPLDEPARGS